VLDSVYLIVKTAYAALMNGCDAILTSDKGMAKVYKHLIKIVFVPKGKD
jgi:hypothetical protein